MFRHRARWSVSRLADLRRRWLGEPPLERALRAKLAAQQREIEKLRLDLDAAITNARAAKADATSRERHMTGKRHAARRKLEVLAREIPSPAILADVFAVRAVHPPLLQYDHAAAVARHQGMLAVSDAYRRVSRDAASPDPAFEGVPLGTIDWCVPADPEGAARQRLIRQGMPFADILQAREFAVGGAMVDIGANVGLTSITRALLGDVRVVYAAEPDAANFAALVRNIVARRLEGIVVPDRVAIAARRETGVLKWSDSFVGHRLLPEGASTNAGSTVDTWPLDAWLEQIGAERNAITFVKVDAQGSEAAILDGAGSLLAMGRAAWQLEVDPVLLAAARTPVTALFERLETFFTHFVDIGSAGLGERRAPISTVRERLAYVGSRKSKTDVIVYRAAR